MKAVMQKDLRENLKLAVIGLAIFSLMLLQAYHLSSEALTSLVTGNYYGGDISTIQPLIAANLQTEAAFFCAIFGAALGWLQTRNEAHRDLWAFLVHRPVTRTSIFLGKTLAGLCLYVGGAGLPLAALVAVARWPGHVAAPFEWEMVLPLVFIFLSGAAYYFAGMLTGLRQARWYGSRCFGLGVAIISSFGIFNLPGNWQPLLGVVIATAILASAAWGAYQSGGGYGGQPRVGRLALVVSVAGGCIMVLMAGCGLVVDLLLAPFSDHGFDSAYYRMIRGGAIYKVIIREGEVQEIVDLEGHPLLDAKTGRKMERKEFDQLGSGIWTAFNYKLMNRMHPPLEMPGYFFGLVNVTDKTLWYLDRHGKLTGYDGRSRKNIGSLDPLGARGVESFLDGDNSVGFRYYTSYNDLPQKHLATSNAIYLVDFKARAVKPVYTLTNGEEICGYEVISRQTGLTPNGQAKRQEAVFLTTQTTVRLVDADGQLIFTLPYEAPGFAAYPAVQISTYNLTEESETNNFAVWFEPNGEMNMKTGWKMPERVVWLGPGGTVTKSANLPVLHDSQGRNWRNELASSLLPLAPRLASAGKIDVGWEALSLAWACLSAGIAWRLTRRYNSSVAASLGWTLFVFLLGIAGLLTLLCVQEWPARVACPNCKRLRAVDRETCEHCHAPFPPPETNGTEIFAPLVKAEAATKLD